MPLLQALLHLALNAAAGMPIIAALGLIAARRGNGKFCLWGSGLLLSLAIPLALLGALWFPCAYIMEISHFDAPLGHKLAPLWHLQGLPWSSSFLASLCSAFLLVFALASIKSSQCSLAGDAWPAKALRAPIALCLGAAALFFASFILIHWPFAGLPEGLPWDRAGMAIFRDAARNYFMSFCPAGAIALAAFAPKAAALPPFQAAMAGRWLAFWALAGCLPTLLITWGTLMGLGLSAHGIFGYGPETAGLICLTLALPCWALVIWRPSYWKPAAFLALLLLLLKTCLPTIIKRIF